MSTLRPIVRREHGDRVGTQNFAAMDEVTRRLDTNPLLRGRYVEVECRQGDVIRVNHGLGRAYQGFVCTTHSGLMVDRSAGDKDKAIVLRVQSPWNFVDEYVVPADAGTIVFKNLNGDIDEAYYFEAAFKTVTGGADLELRPNAASATYEHSALFSDNAVAAAIESTTALISRNSTVGEVSWTTGTLQAMTGSVRTCQWANSVHDGTDTRHITGTWRWTDTTANITQLDFVCSTAARMGAGTKVRKVE